MFEYPARGQHVSIQLLELCQGADSAVDYAIPFWTLAAQSWWNDTALLALFQEGLCLSVLAEMACRDTNISLSSYITTAIQLIRPWAESLPEDRQHNDRLRLCFYCSDRGHRVAEYLELPATSKMGKSFHHSSLNLPVKLYIEHMFYVVTALIDSGAAVNLIDQRLVEKSNLPIIQCTIPLGVMAVDNQPIREGYLACQTTPLTLQIGLFHTENLALYAISSPKSPIILGFP